MTFSKLRIEIFFPNPPSFDWFLFFLIWPPQYPIPMQPSSSLNMYIRINIADNYDKIVLLKLTIFRDFVHI